MTPGIPQVPCASCGHPPAFHFRWKWDCQRSGCKCTEYRPMAPADFENFVNRKDPA